MYVSVHSKKVLIFNSNPLLALPDTQSLQRWGNSLNRIRMVSYNKHITKNNFLLMTTTPTGVINLFFKHTWTGSKLWREEGAFALDVPTGIKRGTTGKFGSIFDTKCIYMCEICLKIFCGKKIWKKNCLENSLKERY